MKNIVIIAELLIIDILLAGCGKIMDKGGMENSYRQISQEEAKKESYATLSCN